MLAPRWHKVLADLFSNKLRTILAVLSIAAGVQVVGTITTSYAIIMRDMDASFLEIDPAGGTMATTDFDVVFARSLAQVPGVGRVEPRATLTGFKLQSGDAPAADLTMTGIANFEQMQLDRLLLRDGSWPGTLELVLERSSLGNERVGLGDDVAVETPAGAWRRLRVAGFVEDRTTNATNAGLLGYVTLDTLAALDLSTAFNSLGFTAAANAGDKEHVHAVGRAIEEQFARAGGLVQSIVVREPGRHPAAAQATAIMGLLVVLGALTLFLSAFLVTNTVAALLAQQIHHIGVMKAIGARTGQIVGMYVVLLLCLGLPALLLAAPLALWAGYAATGVIANFLNFTISSFRIEPLALGVMVILSLGVPLLAGMVPVRNGAVTTIREAIGGYGLNDAFSLGLLGRLSTGWQGSLLRNAPRPLLVSLRNTGRRKARLLLTLATLILAGAIFIGVRSVEASMDAGLARMYRYYLGDVNVNFDRPYPVTEMVGRIAQLPGVARVEGWLFAAGSVVGEGENASARLTVAAPPANSTLVAREVEEGRWLRAEDKNAIVMCTRIMDAHPEWEIGSTVRLALDNRVESNFVIVGTFPFPSGEGNNMAVADYAHLAGLLDQQGQSSTFRLLTSPRDAATQDQVRDALLTAFQEEGYAVEVTSGHTTADALNTILNALVLFLLLMALLVALVGALGLAGTMSINVLERTREIGVMRAIGATNGAVMQLVVVEGLLTGLLSWLVGAIVSVPVGIVLAQILGQGLFDTPFAFVLDGNSLLVWLAIVALLSVVSSALPAWNAARLTVREALAYE